LLIGGIRWYLITLIDFFSRLWIEFEIAPTVNASHVKALYNRGLLAQKLRTASRKPILRTDRGSPNTSWVTQDFFDLMGADLSWARIRRPTDNAITERHYGTIKQEEIYLVGNYPDEKTAREELGKYQSHYNIQRPHQALWNFTPQHVHELNNKTALLQELRQMKQKTLKNRKNYWKTVNQSDLLLNPILSH
jgi:transposase InsO family protein